MEGKTWMAVFLCKFQLASVVLHDPSREAESEPDAFTHILGGEKWLHDPGLKLRRNPGPVVGHGEFDHAPVYNHCQPHPPFSFSFHDRIECVLEKIQQHLPNLNLAAQNGYRWINALHQQLHGVILEAFLRNLKSFI